MDENSFVYISYKHQKNEQLLKQLNRAIYILKLQAQGKLLYHNLTMTDVVSQRKILVEFLENLSQTVRYYSGNELEEEPNMTFLGLAKRFIEENPEDVRDRLEEISRMRVRLQSGEPKGNDFRLLDKLQTLLQIEIDDEIRNLYRL